jgi:hypothetical protein
MASGSRRACCSQTRASSSQDRYTLHVRYGAAPNTHVGTADVWVYQAYTQGCYVSGLLTSNDTG